MKKSHMVVGFLFNRAKNGVILIQKKKPKWMAGKFNGVGGKIEADEEPVEAMRREFKEETGVSVKNWDCVAILRGPDNEVCFFCATASNDVLGRCASVEQELVVDADYPEVLEDPIMPNLKWLLPLCLDDSIIRPVIADHNTKFMR